MALKVTCFVNVRDETSREAVMAQSSYTTEIEIKLEKLKPTETMLFTHKTAIKCHLNLVKAVTTKSMMSL